MKPTSASFSSSPLARRPAVRAHSSHDGSQQAAEQLGHYLDDLFEIPGLRFRFGLDSLLGLIPGVGDTLTSLASVYILATAAKLGVPKITLLRMGMNVGLDYLVGSIPVLGDAFDFWWKANRRNLDLLKLHTAAGGAARKARFSDWVFVLVIIGVLGLVLVGSIAMAIYLATQFVEMLF